MQYLFLETASCKTLTCWGTGGFQVSRPARSLGCPTFGKMTRSLEATRPLAFGQSIREDWPGNRGLWLTKKSDVWAQTDVVFSLFLFVKNYFLKHVGYLGNSEVSQEKTKSCQGWGQYGWQQSAVLFCESGSAKGKKSWATYKEFAVRKKKNTEETVCVKDKF